MTRRLIIGSVVIALLVLVAIVPVSAVKVTNGSTYYYNVSPNIGLGATVYLGEEHLNLVGVAPDTVVGYWASGAPSATTAPSKTVWILNPGDFTVTPQDYGVAFNPGISEWYNGECVAGGAEPSTCLAFLVADPGSDVAIFAPRIATDVSNKAVIRGEDLQFGIANDLYSALTTNRTPVYNTSTGDGYIDLKVRTPSGAILNQLYTDMFASSANATTLTSINATTWQYIWGQSPLDAAVGGSAGVPPFSWHTGASVTGQYVYASGTYSVWAESQLNNMKSNYLDPIGGGVYTGKTVSPVKTITIVPKRSEVGVFRNSHDWYLDSNGNGTWDGNVIDRQYALGKGGDVPVVGDWNGNGITEIGVFRDNHIWNVDYNGNGVWDGVAGGDRIYITGKPGDIPVPGDWNGNNITEMAVFRDNHTWYIDYNGNGIWDGPAGGDKIYITGKPGDIPVPGDWNGDGITEMAVFRGNHTWYIDYNGNGVWDSPAGGDRIYTTGQPGDMPVVGDWNGDGIAEMGVFRPSNHNFYLDFNANGIWDGASVDNRFDFGTFDDIPVSGKW